MIGLHKPEGRDKRNDMNEQENRLIELLKQKRGDVKEDAIVLADVIQSLQSIFERYYASDKTFVKKVQLLGQYTSLLIKTKKSSFPMTPRCNTKDIAEDVRSVINSAIDEIKAIGLPKTNATNNTPRAININNTLSQTQNQSQEINLAVTILLDAIKDDLTGKQQKELLAVVKESSTPEEARKSILGKIKEFGEGVSASIVANILTNPSVWSALGSIV